MIATGLRWKLALRELADFTLGVIPLSPAPLVFLPSTTHGATRFLGDSVVTGADGLRARALNDWISLFHSLTHSLTHTPDVYN